MFLRTVHSVLLASFLVAIAHGYAFADRAPTAQEWAAIEAVLRAEGYTSWEEIELDDDDDDQVWDVDDAIGADGREYDLKLDRSYKIIKRELD